MQWTEEEWAETGNLFMENRMRFPEEELARHAGKTIAWQPDGAAIRSVGNDLFEVQDRIAKEGDDPLIYKYEECPALDEIITIPTIFLD